LGFITEIENFRLNENPNLLFDFDTHQTKTEIEKINTENVATKRYINEYWTSKQRQANGIHEISYRACFKPQLPHFFIQHLTKKGDMVYDPFLGRGTTIIEAALMDRKIIGNDINPLSQILCESRLCIPELISLEKYLDIIEMNTTEKADIDLSMFYHPKTESDIVSLKNYILEKEKNNELNHFDRWIRMVATNRLTGHSAGFFSVYTMPPNQAVSAQRQMKINAAKNQKPEYRNVKKIILKKTKSLIRNISFAQKKHLLSALQTVLFLNNDARKTPEIADDSVHLTVTSPPFLDVVQYAQDNWLRCWFNGIDAEKINKRITMSRTIEQWTKVMQGVFDELFRITKNNGYVAFEVGEIKNGAVKLDEVVAPIGVKSGFNLLGIVINEQKFTKTSNIWGINNNSKGTNSNRIVVLQKKKGL